MKNRAVKKAERRMLVDKLCDLQREICEYERYMGDLFIMLTKREPQTVIQHQCSELSNPIWDSVLYLIKENNELAQKLKSYEEKQ